MNKIALITGATNGIGYYSALEIAKSNYKLTIVGRNKNKTIEVCEKLKKESMNPNIDFIIADLSLISEAKRVAEEFKSKNERLDLLINNAGAIFPELIITSEGIEQTFALNHFSYFVITGLLIDLLKNTPNSRIISVSSQAHRTPKFDLSAIRGEFNYQSFPYYSWSKLANILFTYKLAEKLKGTAVTANCLHPGVVRTGFGAEYKGLMKFIFKLVAPFFISPQKGAETTIYLALSKEVEGISGKYFKNKKPTASSNLSYDKELADDLWKLSEEISGVKF